MKNFRHILIIWGLLLAFNSQGQNALTFKLANPKILYSTSPTPGDYFEFDIQLKAQAAHSLYSGDISMTYNTSSLTSIAGAWIFTLDPAFTVNNTVFNPKYAQTAKNVSAGVANFSFAGDINALNSIPFSANDWVVISTTAFQTFVHVKVLRNGASTGMAGITFYGLNMNGFVQYINDAPSTVLRYTNPNSYDASNFTDTYLGRVYSTTNGWTQTGGSTNGVSFLDWATPVNTSVWDGAATIPTAVVSNATALRIHTGATLTIPPTGQLTTASIENNTANGLTIQSDATGTGSLITTTASGTGTTTAMSYLKTLQWHNVSSPLSGESIATFLTSNTNVGTNGAARGMMDYNPATNVWNPLFNNSTVGNLGGGKGYSLRVSNTPANPGSSVIYTGALQTGAQPVTVAPALWNCIGNPYTSAIVLNNANSFLALNGANLDPIYGGIYVWAEPDASNGLAGKYTIINGTSVQSSFQQGQAFLVKPKTGINTINFSAAMQLHSATIPLKSANAPWPAINLIAEVNGLKNSALITFNSQMTKGLDPTYDAGLLKGASELVVYTKLVEDNGIPFAIQALPENAEMVIPVGVDSKAGGEVTFSSEITNLSPDTKVFLEDKVNKTFTDLTKSAYTTTIAANSSISDRFFLHTSDLISGLDDQTSGDKSWDKLNAYAVRNVELRIVGEVSDKAVVTLCDVLGRVVLVNKLNAGILNTINLPSIRNGIYLITVKDNGKVRTFKILVTA
jgi:hypothetical protein